MEEKFSFILFLITITDLYFNYNNNEFPEYHKTRIISDILSLSAVILPFFLIILICCMGCFIYFQWFNNNTAQKCTFAITIICILLMIIFSILSLFIQVYSIYLYFAYDGKNKISKMVIKLLMWCTFINIIIKLFFSICDFISSIKNKKKETEEEMVELENQERYNN